MPIVQISPVEGLVTGGTNTSRITIGSANAIVNRVNMTEKIENIVNLNITATKSGIRGVGKVS